MRGSAAFDSCFECLHAWNRLLQDVYLRVDSLMISPYILFVCTEPRCDKCHKLRDCALHHRAVVPMERIGRAPLCAVRDSLFHDNMES